MHLLEKRPAVTVVGGRPSSGKTCFAKNLSRKALREGSVVFYWHAEGPEAFDKSEYGAACPDDIENLTVNTDLCWSSEKLVEWALRDKVQDSKSALVIIDVIDFLSEPFNELLSNFRLIKPTGQLIVLSLLPRYLERKTKDHAEEYIRNTYPTDVDSQIKILGTFAGDD